MPQEELGLKHLQKCIPIHSLTREQARIAMAKDVIAALNIQKIQPDSTYLQGTVGDIVGETSMRTVLGKVEALTVCAVGSIFVAYVGRWNNFELPIDVLSGERYFGADRFEMVRTLREFFTSEELHWLESGFGDCRYNGKYDDTFAGSTHDPEMRLRALMRFIISEKGKRLPTDPMRGRWFKTKAGKKFLQTGKVK